MQIHVVHNKSRDVLPSLTLQHVGLDEEVDRGLADLLVRVLEGWQRVHDHRLQIQPRALRELEFEDHLTEGNAT